MSNEVILSICIPTKNRCEYVKKSIESIVSQSIFYTGKIEIIVSDNASTDNTEDYVVGLNNPLIKYFKNENDVLDKNFPLALQRGTGIYRKLSNDSITYSDGSLAHMVSVIESNLDERPLLYFSNGNLKLKKDVKCNADSFWRLLSFRATWIGSFGVWDSDFELIEKNLFAGSETKLWQTYQLLMLSQNRIFFVDDFLFGAIAPKSFSGFSYSVYEIFYINFLNLFLPYIESGTVSQKTYSRIKKDLLLHFFPSYCVIFLQERKNQILDDNSNLFKLIRKAAVKEHCVIRLFIQVYLRMVYKILKK